MGWPRNTRTNLYVMCPQGGNIGVMARRDWVIQRRKPMRRLSAPSWPRSNNQMTRTIKAELLTPEALEIGRAHV